MKSEKEQAVESFQDHCKKLWKEKYEMSMNTAENLFFKGMIAGKQWQQEQSGWVAVKDSLPTDDKYYLLAFAESENPNEIRYGSYSHSDKEWIDTDGEMYYNVTHWQSLPKAPKPK